MQRKLIEARSFFPQTHNKMSNLRQLEQLKIYATRDHDLKILSNCTHLKARAILTEFSNITRSGDP